MVCVFHCRQQELFSILGTQLVAYLHVMSAATLMMLTAYKKKFKHTGASSFT
jgi:hypothetical protein